MLNWRRPRRYILLAREAIIGIAGMDDPILGRAGVGFQAPGAMLHTRGHVRLLDSDDLRRKLTPSPTYSDEERDWFYDLITFLAALLTDNGVNVLIAATAPRRAYHEAARDRVAQFAEVYVACALKECQARDPKGLWERADKGEIATLPGAGVPHEQPEYPEVRVDTAHLSIEETARRILGQLDERAFSPVGALWVR